MAIPKKLPETLTPAECKVLVAQAKPRYPTGLRDLCMLRLMLNTGLRSSECLSLKVRDIDWLSGKLMVREGKCRGLINYSTRLDYIADCGLDYVRTAMPSG